jgi:AcrR family transcriptional regulator
MAKEPASDASQRSGLVMRAILDHATELFDQRGYAETRLQDIADSVNLSRPTIYYYFNSKEDILIAILWEMVGVERVMEPARDETLTPYQRLRELMLRIGGQVVEKPARVRIMDRNLAQLPAEVRRDFTTERNRLRAALTEAIEAAIDAGEVRVVDPEVTTSIIFGAITGMPTWYHPRRGTFSQGVLEAVVDVILDGVAIPKQARHGGTFDDAVERIHEDLNFLSRTYRRAGEASAQAGE